MSRVKTKPEEEQLEDYRGFTKRQSRGDIITVFKYLKLPH